jgi:ethanolamine permease
VVDYGGLLIATVIASLLYTSIIFTLGEFFAMLSFAGAAAAYTQITMGKKHAFIAGLADNTLYKIYAALLWHRLGDYSSALFETDPAYIPLY